MCGIAALFSVDPSESIIPTIHSALEIARHRGPDGRGEIFGRHGSVIKASDPVTPNWGLGHVRLSILDVSSAGHQPMSFGGEKLWITYNGEVFNYLELRAELAQLGNRFRTGTDTEVILAAYTQWGEECVLRFRGMFAFVIVYLNQNRVFAARDRLGVKPLYFWSNDQFSMIVSEPKQLKACPQYRATISPQHVADYLIDGVVEHDSEGTFFQGVQSLPSAHTVSWKIGELPNLRRANRYWDPSTTSRRMTWRDAVDETRRLVLEAVQLRLRSDVPVGACLSGGIDSSSLVGTITRHFGQQIATFSVCWDDERYDEQHFMDAVNQHCNTVPTKVFPSVEEVVQDFDDFLYFHDEPVGQLSQYAQYRAMRLAKRQGVTVVLDGQGGDEALCGYRKYSYFYLRCLIATGRLKQAAGHAYSALRHGDPRLLHFHLGQRYLPKWLRASHDSPGDLLQPHWKSYLRKIWSERMDGVTRMHEHQLADLKSWSLPALLRYEDRNSMAHGIEARVPFVDHVFVEHCLTLPEEHFFRNGRSKRLLTEAMGSLLPQAVHDRRCKRGFDTPQPSWMRAQLGRYLENVVCKSKRIEAILNTRALLKGFQDIRQGGRGISDSALFRFACLAQWLERFDVSVDEKCGGFRTRAAA